MKKTILTSVLAGLFCACANASDGGIYFTETESMTNYVTYAPAAPVAKPVVKPVAKPCPCKARVTSSANVGRPCPHYAGAPVRVKTHTEVIDHYQMYQPVTVYQPAGTYAERRVVETPRPCNRCKGF